MHTADRPFKCLELGCTFATAQRDKLTRHMRSHTGERPCKCPEPGCEYATATATNLRVHMRTHTGEKPFVCTSPHCRFSTAQHSNLKKHERSAHGIVRDAAGTAQVLDAAAVASARFAATMQVQAVHMPAQLQWYLERGIAPPTYLTGGSADSRSSAVQWADESMYSRYLQATGGADFPRSASIPPTGAPNYAPIAVGGGAGAGAMVKKSSGAPYAAAVTGSIHTLVPPSVVARSARLLLESANMDAWAIAREQQVQAAQYAQAAAFAGSAGVPVGLAHMGATANVGPDGSAMMMMMDAGGGAGAHRVMDGGRSKPHGGVMMADAGGILADAQRDPSAYQYGFGCPCYGCGFTHMLSVVVTRHLETVHEIGPVPLQPYGTHPSKFIAGGAGAGAGAGAGVGMGGIQGGAGQEQAFAQTRMRREWGMGVSGRTVEEGGGEGDYADYEEEDEGAGASEDFDDADDDGIAIEMGGAGGAKALASFAASAAKA